MEKLPDNYKWMPAAVDRDFIICSLENIVEFMEAKKIKITSEEIETLFRLPKRCDHPAELVALKKIAEIKGHEFKEQEFKPFCSGCGRIVRAVQYTDILPEPPNA